MYANLQEASPLEKVPPNKATIHSMPAKKKVTTMSESEYASSTDEEDNRSTLGAELESGVLSSEQNNIPWKIKQNKLVRKCEVFNLPITHIHKPPIDVKIGWFPLEIRELHKLHV